MQPFGCRLGRTWDILSRTGSESDIASDEDRSDESEEGEGDSDAEPSEDSDGGSKVKLKPWNQRRGNSMGYEPPEGRVVPLIDRIHRVMHLWREGELQQVDEYLDQHALRRNELFKHVVQSLIELSTNSERSLLESISNHIGAKGAVMCFDKIDVETGCEVRSPEGTKRRLKQPWSILAYQIAGDVGLKLLNANGKAEERTTPPAENTLTDLLPLPLKSKIGTLSLLDEVLLCTTVRCHTEPGFLDILIGFFRYLTQAAASDYSAASRKSTTRGR